MSLWSAITDRTPLARSHLWPRWLFLRALGLIFFSAFYSLAFQIHGLIGTRGILPAGSYLAQVRQALGGLAPWYAPTLLWLGAGDTALTIVVAAGIVASLLLTINVWPRWSVVLCTLLFLSCVAALQDFSSYQSDGMLLEAGLISAFFAPRGMRPGLGAIDPPSRLTRFMLEWEWFRIYFESGVVKLLSGDPHWRNLTAMDEYYQNGPLPTWIGWYVQHFPHWYHAGTVLITLAVELVIVWAVFLPRPFRLACAAIVTLLQIGIILTANYAFLNYLVLVLGVLLLDDAIFDRLRLRVPDAAEASRGTVRRGVENTVFGVLFYASVVAFLIPRALPRSRCRRASSRHSASRTLWPLRGDDAGALRDRISGQPRRPNLDRLSVSIQAAGRERASRNLRTVPTALRVESLVRVARTVAGIELGRTRAATTRGGKPERAEIVSARSVRRQAAGARAHGAVSVLVHRPRDQTSHRRLVAAHRARRVHGNHRANRSSVRARALSDPSPADTRATAR